MIDLRAARSDPDRVRPGIERKGGGEAFAELLEADARWRELVPRVDELRGRQKLKGKPSPEQVEELKQVKADLRRLEAALADAESRRDELLQQVPNPAHESVPDELSIVAWDDSLLCQVVHPPITTLTRDIAEFGALGTRQLLAVIDGHPADDLEAPRAVLTPRGSTAPPAGNRARRSGR